MKERELKQAVETIVPSPEMYERILEKRKYRPHQGMKISVIFVVLTFLFGIGTVVSLVNYRVRYQQYTVDLAQSISTACEENTMRAHTDQEIREITEENAHKIGSYLLLAKSGWPEREKPEEEGILIELGNGATIELWEVPYKENGKKIFLWYTYGDGRTYGYSSAKINLGTLRTFLLDKDNEVVE